MIIMDIKAKLANARKIFPGMSKNFYILTDFMSENAHDQLSPIGVIFLCLSIKDDLKGKDYILQELQWIPQFIDTIAEPNFAESLRKEWLNVFGSVPPKKAES